MTGPGHIRPDYRCVNLLVSLCIVYFLPHASPAQENESTALSAPSESVSIPLSQILRDSVVNLEHQFILPSSDTLEIEPGRRLLRGVEYTVDYRHGLVTLLLTHLFPEGMDTSHSRANLQVRFSYFPFVFRESYFKRELRIIPDSAGAETLRVSSPSRSFSVDDIFGPNLQKSGSLVRGFTVGSNRDLSLNSGLRLQLSGKLTSDIDLTASLTDESTPIQPEGTTQTLQEFDKVFVEMRGTDVAATLGDFNLDLTGTEFARLSRKLQGGRGTADYRTPLAQGSVMISAAAPRGKFTTNQFQGIEGVQGPYRLSGRGNERGIIVIAGTEKVYIDGELQTRGETHDYTIDYSTGEITFTAGRLVNAASRIVVDFEYTDRQYSRSFFGTQAVSGFLENKAKLMVSFLREADDPDAPIDLALSDSARAVLAAAGSDPNKAVLSGVTRVDSNGLYVAVDTVLANGAQVRFYRYAPGPAAQYTVYFSFVGAGKGEYVRRQSLVYEWMGPGNGDYQPVRFLPLPQSLSLLDLHLALSPRKDVGITGEFGRTIFDANRFSPLDDAQNAGNAYRVTAAFSPRHVKVGTMDIGSFDLSMNERFVDRRFVPIDRTNDIEFGRKWGLDSAQALNEEIQEASLKYLPVGWLTVGGGYGKNTRGDAFRSVRNDATLSLQGEGLPTVNYLLESVRSKDYTLDNASRWTRQKGAAAFVIGIVTPAFRFETEDRQLRSLTSGAINPGSFRYALWAPRITVRDWGKISLSGELEWRTDDLVAGQSVVRASKSFTQAYGLRLSEWNNLTSSLDVTLRTKRLAPEFTGPGNTDVSTVLVKSQSRYAPLNRGVVTDLVYQVATEQTSQLERVFVQVAQGAGNYRYLGDLNGNGIAEESEFVPARFDGDYIAVTVPTDRFLPIIDLKTSVRLRIDPRLFLASNEGFIRSIASTVSAETYIRIEEKSSEEDLKQIYLLHFSRFLRESTTIAGSQLLTQDLFLFEGKPEFSARFRFSQRKGLNQFTSATERTYGRERSLRLRWQLISELSNQIDLVNSQDRVTSLQQTSRLRDISSNSISLDFSYRPQQEIEVGCKLVSGNSIDRYQQPEQSADINTQTLRFVYAMRGAGQIRAEIAREEVGLRGVSTVFPFELTGGRVEGKTWVWRAGLDYRVTQFIQATMNYDGRSEGGRQPVHTARAEVRAFF
jgi:hypothetical protein